MNDLTKKYWQKGPPRRRRFRRWFHNGRLRDFSDFIKPGDTLLSVGAGTGDMEAKLLRDKFNNIYTIEIRGGGAKSISEKGLKSVQGSALSLPFRSDSFDTIIACGFIEHINPNELEFVKEAQRCLKSNGRLYLTIPVEVGLGGLFRYLGKNFTYGGRSNSPDGIKRYFDYSFEELLKKTPHDSPYSHRYYNYTYTLEDLKSVFGEVIIQGWPFPTFRKCNLILFIEAENECPG